MTLRAEHQLRLANERIREQHLAAARARLPQRPSRPSSLRRSIGHSIIRIGARLAAEPNLRPAQSRGG
jgi:hypothetical protein